MTDSPTADSSDADSTGSTDSHPYAVLVSKDLIFISRITGTAEGFGWRVVTSFASGVAKHAADANCRGFFIDLAMSGLDIDAVMDCVRDDQRSIAFGPHVHVAKLEAATAAGCDTVLPRSRFDSTLNEILAEIFQTNSQ